MADDVLEKRLFHFICRSGGFAKLSDLLGQSSPLRSRKSAEEAEIWLKTQRKFGLVKDRDGNITGVRVDFRKKLCQQYVSKGSCGKKKGFCKHWHICKKFIEDKCNPFDDCELSHDFHEGSNREMLKELCLEKYCTGSLRKIIAWSLPKVCQSYLRGQCNSNNCSDIHVCHKAIQELSCRCSLSHNLDDNKHNLTLLKLYNLVTTNQVLNPAFVRCNILCLRASSCSLTQDYSSHGASSLEGKTAISGISKIAKGPYLSTPGIYDAKFRFLRTKRDFLVKEKEKRTGDISSTNKHYCSLPYRWQYKVPDVGVWNSFGNKDNARLERLYCDANNARMDYNPVEILDFSEAESADVLNVLGYTITIDFDDMLMTLRPLDSQDTLISELRRLPTLNGPVDPSEPTSMSSTWFWEDNGNVWRTYDKDCSGRELQGLIEQAYLDYLRQRKVREKFRFATAEHEYNLFFRATGMYQVNLKTGTMRQVKRRPSKVIPDEGNEHLKRMYGDVSYKKEEDGLLRAEKTNFTSHWSSMPPKLDYYRAHVDQSSVEFKDLEKLFRKTMNDYGARIESIDRVQNLFMMEKYCRKKEKMIESQQTVNERPLFHGTTPEAVEAICKRNFDWRLSGKHATRFGEGSYFARDASYSHRYAKKDAHGFRHMFVAKVLVGSFIEGHANYRTPPPKNPEDPGSDLYDSCVDNQSNPRVFVVFDTDQLYPEYIISYSTVSKLDSADSHQHSLPQRSASPKRAILKSSDIRFPAFSLARRTQVISSYTCTTKYGQ